MATEQWKLQDFCQFSSTQSVSIFRAYEKPSMDSPLHMLSFVLNLFF